MAAKPRFPLPALTALVTIPFLAVPLALAQSIDGAISPAAPQHSADPPPPPPPVERAPAALAPPAPTPAQEAAPSGRPTPAPPPVTAIEILRPTEEERRSVPPRRFDESLDALVRDGVVTPQERARVRNGLPTPTSLGFTRQLCLSGALSTRECQSGVAFRSPNLRGPDGEGNPSAGAGAPFLAFGGIRSGIEAAPLPPITVPVTALLSGSGGSFRLTDVFRVTPRPRPVGGNGNNRLLFPLIGSAVTTSNFGWRLHPVLGSWLMHAGRDLAAPEGTPVVAALTGRVVSSGLAGGYGLAVELEHDRPRRRTLYGHLSELYVKEGETVRQGEVIGRVGSTGLSTGPHLHFELRLPQDGGWVATDPGDLDPGGAPGVPGLRGLDGLVGSGQAQPPDAVALLLGQLLQTLERPRSPLPLPGERVVPPPAATSRPASPTAAPTARG